MKTKKILWAALLLPFVFSCEKTDMEVQTTLDDSPVFLDWSGRIDDAAHGRRKSRNPDIALYTGEFVTAPGSAQIGRTIFFMDVGNKQLGHDFVPGLHLDGTNDVSYYVDENRPSNDLPITVTTAAIDRAMNTWDGVVCSDLGLFKLPYQKQIKTGFITALVGLGGSFDYVADVMHGGWLPGSFFDLLAPGGSDFILAVTFTLIFTDANGNPVDIDNNGKLDVAWREIYYNDNFSWADGAHFDVETIALHEAGHGLSQGHFGAAFLDPGSKQLHFSPRAVMNAAYSGIQTTIVKTDNAGHCSIWSEWPDN